MSIEVEVDEYIDINSADPIIVDVSNEAYKVNDDQLTDSILLNDKYEITPSIAGVVTGFTVPKTLEEALFVTIPSLRNTLLDELNGKTLALIDELKYDLSTSTEDGTINQRLTKLSADYIAATNNLQNYALTSELSKANIAQEYLIDRFNGTYIQEREGWRDSSGANWDHNEAIMAGRMAAEAEYDANGALVRSAKEVADTDYPLTNLLGALAWSTDGKYNSTLIYSDLLPTGYYPVWKIYTAITSQDIYDKSVRVENQQASYSEDIRAFADNQKAYASRVTTLEATSGENTAKINTTAQVMVGKVEYYLHDYPNRAIDGSEDPIVGDVAVFSSNDDSFSGAVRESLGDIQFDDDRLEYTATIKAVERAGWQGWERTMASELSKSMNITAAKINGLQAQVDQQIDSWFQDTEPMYLESDVDAAHNSNSTTTVDLITNDLVWDINSLTMYEFIAADETGVALNSETYPTINRWIAKYKYPEADWRATDIINNDTSFNSTTSEVYKHKADLYYDNASGAAYRFTRDTQSSKYVWLAITDAAMTKAMADAAKAQAAADGSMKFYSGNTAPDRTYGTNEVMMGDVWVPSADTDYTVKDSAGNDVTLTAKAHVEYVWQDNAGIWQWAVSSTANKLDNLLDGSVDGSSIKVGDKNIVSYVNTTVDTQTDHMLNVYTGYVNNATWIDRMQNGTSDSRGDMFISTTADGVTTTYTLQYDDHTGEIDSALTTVITLETDKTILAKNGVMYLYIASQEDAKPSDQILTDTSRWIVINSQWKEVEGASNVQALKDLKDGKRAIYTTDVDPTLTKSVMDGDMWIPPYDTIINGTTYTEGSMYYYKNSTWTEPTVLTSITDRLAKQSDNAFNILHQTSTNIPAPYNDGDIYTPRIYELLHNADESGANGTKFSADKLDAIKALLSDLWECSVETTTAITSSDRQEAIPAFIKGTTYVLKIVDSGSTYTDVNGNAGIQNNMIVWSVANDSMTKLAEYSEKNSTIHGGHVIPTKVNNDVTLTITPPTAHVGDMWVPDKCVMSENDGTIITFTIDKSIPTVWVMNNITDSTGATLILSEDYKTSIMTAMKADKVGDVVIDSIGTVKYISGRSYTLDNRDVWSENMEYTNDDYAKKIVNGEVALTSDVKVNINGEEDTLLGYLHKKAYNDMNLYSGTKYPTKWNDKIDGKLRYEGVANGDIYAWHTFDTVPGGDNLAVEVGYEYIEGTFDLTASLPSPYNDRKYADVTFDSYDINASTADLLMKSYFIAKRVGDAVDGDIQAYWVRTDVDKGVVSGTIKDFADTTFGRLEDLKDGKRTILLAKYIDENNKAIDKDNKLLDTTNLMPNDVLILTIDGNNPDATNITTWKSGEHYYIKGSYGEYTPKYRPTWSAPSNSDKYTKAITSGKISFTSSSTGDYCKIANEYDTVDFVKGGSKNAISIFGAGVTSTAEETYKYYENGEFHYWNGTSWISTEVAMRKKIPHWAAGTSNFTTDPVNGAITGWSYTDGSDHGSEFVISADNLKIQSASASVNDIPATPFSVVEDGVDSNGNKKWKSKFNGEVEFSSVTGSENVVTKDEIFNPGTTSIDGGKITTGIVDAKRIDAGNLVVKCVSSGGDNPTFEIKADETAGPKEDKNYNIYGASIKGGTISGVTIDATSTITTPFLVANKIGVYTTSNPEYITKALINKEMVFSKTDDLVTAKTGIYAYNAATVGTDGVRLKTSKATGLSVINGTLGSVNNQDKGKWIKVTVYRGTTELGSGNLGSNTSFKATIAGIVFNCNDNMITSISYDYMYPTITRFTSDFTLEGEGELIITYNYGWKGKIHSIPSEGDRATIYINNL